MKKTLLSLVRCAIIVAAGTLYGCGGENTNSVAYIGNTLVLDGKNFSDSAAPLGIVPGEVVVVPQLGMREEVRKLVERYGLRIAREEDGHFLVLVPMGYERQWADALRNEPDVADAGLILL